MNEEISEERDHPLLAPSIDSAPPIAPELPSAVLQHFQQIQVFLLDPLIHSKPQSPQTNHPSDGAPELCDALTKEMDNHARSLDPAAPKTTPLHHHYEQ